MNHRPSLGRFGESLAEWLLAQHGVLTRQRNTGIGSGEVDLVCSDGRAVVVVEVRTRRTAGDPIDAVDRRKRQQVARLAARIGADRVDLVGIGLHRYGVDIHWVPDAL